MIILGGLGVDLGRRCSARVALAFIDRWLIPDMLDTRHTRQARPELRPRRPQFGIFGFLLVIMMVLRPEGLFPERRRKIELTEGIGTDEADRSRRSA